MAYDVAWTFNNNQTPASADTLQHLSQSALFFLKTNLITAGWSVVSSSNGTTQSAADNWSTSADVVHNTSASARSWILLKSPVGFIAGADGSGTGEQSRIWLCIEAVGTSSTDYSKFNPTVYSTAPTGGSTTAIPTGGNAQSIDTNGTTYLNGTVESVLFNFSYTAKGGFYFVVGRVGASTFRSTFSLIDLVDVNNYGAIAYPYACLMGVQINNSTLDVNSFYSNPKIFNYDGTSGNCLIMTLNNGSNYPGANEGISGDINNNIFTVPSYVYTQTSAKTFLIGKIPDLSSCGNTSFAAGSTSPATGTPEYSVVSRLWLPSNVGFSL